MGKDGGSRKVGANTRKPSAARYKLRRPDLRKKIRNVLRNNGEEAMTKWVFAKAHSDTNAAAIVMRYRDEILKKHKV